MSSKYLDAQQRIYLTRNEIPCYLQIERMNSGRPSKPGQPGQGTLSREVAGSRRRASSGIFGCRKLIKWCASSLIGYTSSSLSLQNANILALANFLQLIRRPYLDSSNRGSLKASGKSNVDLSGLQHIKHLSEREKDEIDVQVKSNLKKCMHQIKELEQAEKSMFFNSVY